MQSGFTGTVEEQPMHFPKAEIRIDTPLLGNYKQNVTDIIIRFPAVCVDNETIIYQATPAAFRPYRHPITPPLTQESHSKTTIIVEGQDTSSSELKLETILWFTELRRLIHIR
jgi:hypothetical protein